MKMLRTHAPPLGLLALACLAVAAPLVGGVPAGGDALLQELDFSSLLGQALSGGGLPAWNPYLLCGTPHLAAMSGGPLHPVHLLLAPLGPELAVGLAAVVHLLVAAVGCYALAYRLCGCPLGAMAGGAIFALGGFCVLHLEAGHVSLLGSYSMIPLALLGVDRLLARQTLARMLVASLFLALLVLSGHGQMIAIGMLGVALFCVVRLIWWRPSGPRPGVMTTLWLLGAALLGALVSAVQWLPALDFVGRSGRGAVFDPAFYAIGQLQPADLALALAPGAVARAYDFPWETCGYAGAAGLVLVLASLRRERRGIGLGALMALGVTLAVGPVFLQLAQSMPGFGLFRVPGRFLALATVFGALLAAMTLARPNTKRLLTCCGVVAVLVVAGGMLMPRQAPALYWIAAAGPVALAGVLAWAARADRISEQNLRRGLALLVVLELVVFAWPRVRAAEHVPSIPPGIATHLRAVGLEHRLMIMVPERYGRRPKLILNMAVRARVPSVGGYVPAAPERMRGYFVQAAGHGPKTQMVRFFAHRLTPALANLGLRFVLAPQGIRAPSFLRPVRTEAGMTLFELERPWRRARIVRKMVKAWDAASAASWASHPDRMDLRTHAVLEKAAPAPAPGKPSTDPEQVRWLGMDLRGMDLDVVLKRPALLKLADAYDERWVAQSNGRPVEVLPVDGVLMGLHLGAGSHRVSLRYTAGPLGVGVALSMAGICLLAMLSLLAWYRRRRAKG